MNPSHSVTFEGRRFSRWVKFGLPLLSLSVFWLFYHEAPLLFNSIMISWGLYFLLNPLVDWMERHSVRRALAVLIVLMGFIVVIYMIWLRFLAFSSDFRTRVDLDAFQKNIVTRIQTSVLWIEDRVPTLKRYIEPEKDPTPKETPPSKRRVKVPEKTPEEIAKFEAEKVKVFIEEKLNVIITRVIFEGAPDFAKTLLSMLPNLILIPYFSFFFLKDGRYFKKTAIEWIPNRYFEPALKFSFEMGRRMRRYFQSLLLDCLLVGILVGVGCYMVGCPYPVVIGTIAFMFNTIPLIGPLTYGAITLLIAVAAGSPANVLWGVVIVFGISRIVDDLILIPILYGRSNHLHPILVVVSVLLGESIAGAWGMFLAIPVTSLLILGANIIREISMGEDEKPLPESFSAPFA